MVSAMDRQIVRELAQRVRAAAELPVMRQRAELWTGHNKLHGKRPMVLCFPEGSWTEIPIDKELRCEDPTLRRIENQLRTRLYSHTHINDDNVVEPFFDVGWKVDMGNYGVQLPKTFGDNRGSYHWDPPLKNLDEDLKKLRPRTFSVDRDASRRNMELAHEVLGDILPVRRRASLWWTLGLTMTAAYLVGLEELMLAMYDNPAGLHRLMAFLRDDHMNMIQWAQREGLLTPRNTSNYVGSGGVGYTDELPGSSLAQPAGLSLRDVWGFGESQETVGISPDHFAEFILPYQLPLLEKFGLNCYGCCEQLEHRIDVVLEKIPRLRRVSVAPQANQEILAQKLAGKYVFSRKVDPIKVCVGFHEESIRAELRNTLALAGDQPLEFILKDTHTVQNEPWRLGRWVQIAREEIDAWMSKR